MTCFNNDFHDIIQVFVVPHKLQPVSVLYVIAYNRFRFIFSLILIAIVVRANRRSIVILMNTRNNVGLWWGHFIYICIHPFNNNHQRDIPNRVLILKKILFFSHKRRGCYVNQCVERYKVSRCGWTILYKGGVFSGRRVCESI